MPLSQELREALRTLLKEQTDHNYSDQELTRTGIAIMKFVIAKQKRTYQITLNDKNTEGKKDATRSI